jgi:hypothetical protein
MPNIRRSYIDNAEGQLHVWSWEGAQAHQPSLICLPPVPFGGRFFGRFATAYEVQYGVPTYPVMASLTPYQTSLR